MPQIIVTADRPDEGGEGTVMWRERVTPADLESRHFREQLAERIAWAVSDAQDLELRRDHDAEELWDETPVRELDPRLQPVG
jgi:hypothetical protein